MQNIRSLENKTNFYAHPPYFLFPRIHKLTNLHKQMSAYSYICKNIWHGKSFSLKLPYIISISKSILSNNLDNSPIAVIQSIFLAMHHSLRAHTVFETGKTLSNPGFGRNSVTYFQTVEPASNLCGSFSIRTSTRPFHQGSGRRPRFSSHASLLRAIGV